MKSNLQKKIDAALRFAGRPEIFFYLLIWLMVLLMTGTIAEKYIGLYLSQKTYFSSFIIWIGGFLPVPGGYTTLALIFVSLLSKLIIENWTKQKLGTLIIHWGALLLLLGGFLTAAFSSEGSMLIEEGASSNYISAYHQHELAITDTTTNKDIVFGQDQIAADQTLSSSLPFTVTIESVCENCTITQRAEPITDGSTHGMLVANDMQPAPPSPDEAQNHIGMIFHVNGADKKTDGHYAIFEDMPIEQHLDAGGKKYLIELRRQRTPLPFEVKLIKFEKQMYPGTDKPRSFQSEVILKDGNLKWHSLISMNNPLRYKGYTFYQSSFIDGENTQTTVLAVVKNIGATFPYISSITMCIGLLIHMFLRIPKLKIKKST